MPRAIWKGTLGFGLVTIGIELHSAEAPNELDLDMLDKRDNARIRYQKINEATGDVVPQNDIVKGFPVAKKKYVVLSDADLKAANPKSTQTVDIIGFVARDAIDLIYFDRPYFVAPLKGNEKAYALLRDALRKSDQVALAQIVVRTRQYVAAVYPWQTALVVHLLRYQSELKAPAAVGIPETKAAVRPAELAMAEQLMEGMTTKWNPEDFSDTYRKDLLKLIKQRSAKGGAKASKEPPAEEKQPETGVLDLMAALKRSVAAKGKKSAPKTSGRGTRPSPSHRAARKSA